MTLVTASPALHPWRDRATGTLLAAAVGDALGWPFERRDRTRPLTGAPGGSGGFFAWERFAGSRQQRIPERVGAGDYSDDTQMTIAVARARLMGGRQWLAWLERVEWPFLLDYERGAGASVKAACRAWARGRAPWEAPSSAVARYFATGANGAAMRIAPHVLVHHQDLRFDELATDVVRDAATTHGHPRALLGALVQAYALWVSLREPAPLPYGWLVDTLLDDAKQWQQPFWRALPDAWQHRAGGHFDDRFDQAWLGVAAEVEQLLAAAQRELREGAISAPTVFLTRQGLTSTDARGSGTLCAVAAAYLAARSASSPDRGLATAAHLEGADTDTLASMTGALLGAALGTEWLGGYGRSVQDRTLLINLAEGLLTGPEKARMKTPTYEQAHRARTVFTEQISDVVGGPHVLQLPDRRNAQVSPATGDNASRWLEAVTQDGQTLYLRRPDSRQIPLFDVEPSPAATRVEQPRPRAPKPSSGALLQGAYLPVADAEHVRRTLKDFFGLDPDHYGPTWVSYGQLVLAQDREASATPAQPVAQLHVSVTDPHKTRQLLAGRDLMVMGDEDTGTFRIQIDPLLSVVFAAAGDRRVPRWDSGF
ncbi:ADP-ribosylglycohydrolase family protein [Kitasatospora sp. A2-31]|uniref:ADP-ribosylglycohydrolase family protein n=1 Tax=Kitasatospora sp. A2-31 TaxID=2916414 RepID=UPI001EEBC731|nr:ADP-ribosylglycohydrolase family protein [Kitasatospora sp. A2-31]MCG6497358.1 ADP-ribosylglycohydrolase family protein [Kitasatospora sp. A2-31]